MGRGFFAGRRNGKITLFYWLRLKALGTFLHLQRHFSPPAPSHTQSRAKIKSNLVWKGDQAGRGLRPLPAHNPSHFMKAACFRFEIEMGGVVG